MTQDDRMETITDPAQIRATDEPDERTTPAPVGAAVALDLDAARANAATEGTWRADSHSHIQNGCRCLSCYDDPTVYQLSVFLDCEDVPRWDDDATRCTQSGFQTWADADFAAHAREDVPALATEVRRLTESRATVAANLAASLLRAEAEVVTLRARLAAVEALADDRTRHAYVAEKSRGYSVTHYGNPLVLVSDLRAALATTGEGE